MKMLTNIVLLFLASLLAMCSSAEKSQQASHNKSYPHVELSKELVRTAKEQQDASEIMDKLAAVSAEELSAELDTDEAKKAFWINVYNGSVQHILMKQPELFEDRGAFFKKDQVRIAGEIISLDKIEHGIIRGSKIKWLLGLVSDPFADKYERTFRTDSADGRIHFALNCGAKSCPYIAIYNAPYMNEQLDEIARQFLNRTSTYEPDEEKVFVTSLFSWFRGDFGGKSGIRDFLRKYDVIPEEADPSLSFQDYDWTLELGNYTDLSAGKTAAK
ncbi:DUF547 domain-containing protein [Tunicatimonas pelagia]|uniref:DUF547 domain-containing protein n=1 Tax=Tunicatimonas pelagia TaxID=931531 RepID=UPI0026659884|nr:DUF547 domain-containing protein [Tunicatimonas pelagia]WKN40966.1 DUF547 domain-containing protein [Tunicatimonas pelagia]